MKAGFSAIPEKKDKALHFQITRLSGGPAFMNLSIVWPSGKIVSLQEHFPIGLYKSKFDADDYEFDKEPEFRVALYGWKTHFACQVGFF